ncbi:CapA family protein [Glutamicibacter sp.]|uniref:CapA family protein n=1 Tax=Glutamicibacter sp. TaxID=1931995 RepID=UPI0028BD7EE3|nr:CapA family protein [Glutamicibacter sp.]
MTHRRLSRITVVVAAVLLPSTFLAGCSAGTVPAPEPVSTTASASSQESTPEANGEPPASGKVADDSEFSLMVTGDVLLHPQLLDEASKAAQEADGNGKDFDFQPLLKGLKPYVQDADVALCNMETPIGEPPYSGYPVFTVPAQIASDLEEIGYDGCTTASNHSMDDGTDGVVRTLDALQNSDLFTTGSYRSKADQQRPPILESHGVELGVIASTYSLNGMKADADWRVDTGVNADRLIQRAKKARKSGADIVVAAIHDGSEYSTRPTAAQRKLGHALADSGAFDFIYMHHTHSVLPIEKYKGKWIVYGLGNSVAKHATPTILNREGIGVKATFSKDDQGWSVSKLQYVPHQLSKEPVTWCEVATSKTCVPPADAKASLKRTETTVDAYGAFDDGLTGWKLP